jgi:hypothetical protein
MDIHIYRVGIRPRLIGSLGQSRLQRGVTLNLVWLQNPWTRPSLFPFHAHINASFKSITCKIQILMHFKEGNVVL